MIEVRCRGFPDKTGETPQAYNKAGPKSRLNRNRRLASLSCQGGENARTAPGGGGGGGENPQLELLWRRLEDAKLQLDLCHNYLKEIQQDKSSGALPFSDGNYAHVQALGIERVAIQRYFSALDDFKIALMQERAATGASREEPAVHASQQAITPRELEILRLIALGKSSRQIAALLGISFKTVTTHRYRLQQKLKVHNMADLTRAALQMGLIELDEH